MTIPQNDHTFAAQVRGGDKDALGAWLDQHSHRLEKMIRLRMDRRVVRRVSASDVLQDAFLEAARRIKEYLDNPSVPFFIWLRFLVGQRIAQLHRSHLGVQARDVDREFPLGGDPFSSLTSYDIAAQLVSSLTSPSIAIQKAELKNRLHEVLCQMDPMDREVLALRHFEQLSNAEVAHALELSVSAASKRYIRALDRLRCVLSAVPDLASEFSPQSAEGL